MGKKSRAKKSPGQASEADLRRSKHRPGTSFSMEVPASALGPPRNEFEAASPALQASRMLGEGTLPGIDRLRQVDIRDEVPPAGAPILMQARKSSLPPAEETYQTDVANPAPLVRYHTADHGPAPGEFRLVEPGDQVEPPYDRAEGDAGAWIGGGRDVPPQPPEIKANPEAVPVRTSWTAGDVLEEHTRLTERHARPDAMLLDFYEYYIQDAFAKNPARAQGMLYPVDMRGIRRGDRPSEAKARHLSGIIAHGLTDALTFQVTSDMVTVMRSVHDKTQLGVTYLDEAELPSEAGFAFLDKPWLVIDTNDNVIPVRALTWEVDYAWTDGTESYKLPRPERIACVRVGLWTYMDDDVAFGRWPGREDRAREVSGQIGELTLMHIALLPFGERFGMPAAKDKREAAKSILGFVHTLWMFLGMEIVGTPKAEGIPRLIQRRASKSLRHAEVRVVVLRRIKHPKTGESVGVRDIDWSCRWVVQGHLRHIDRYEGERHHAIREVRPHEEHDVCAICLSRGQEARVTWVHPYVKGPEGAPLRAADKVVYKLAR